MFFFFFQAEDGIRDYDVTGVQTCALPICFYFYSAIGISWTAGGDYEFSGNTFLDNPIDVGVSNGDIKRVLDFTDNYWGSADKLEISRHILDYFDDFQRPRIVFEPFLTEASPDAPAILANLEIGRAHV